MPLDNVSYQRMNAAFIEGDLEALRREIGHLGNFPNTAPHLGIGMPLVYAIYHSPLVFVRELLEAGADPDGSDGDGFPPLTAALTCTVPSPGATTRDDVEELIELLLASGADIGQRGMNDCTPLHFAATQGDLVLVELLLRHGADPNEITRIDDLETALELAERANHTHVADLLRPKTTRLSWEEAARTGDLAVLRRMRRDGQDINTFDGHGLTALMRAAHNGHRDAVAWLISQGADLDHTAKYRLSALMLAVIATHDKVARLLVRSGADASLQGSGAPGFADKTAADLAEDAGNKRLAAYIRNGGSTHP